MRRQEIGGGTQGEDKILGNSEGIERDSRDTLEDAAGRH